MHRPLLLDITFLSMHPSDILIKGKHQPAWLPVCDHYARSEKRIRTSPVSDLRLHIPIETHVAVHEIRDMPVPGEVDCLPLGLVHSGPARGDVIHVSLTRIPVQLRFARAAHAKMKIAAPCRALCEIASHNEPTDRCVTLAIASHVIRAAESREIQHEPMRHQLASDRRHTAVLQEAQQNRQSMPESAGVPM
jgi:hypothetical protein